MGLFNTLRNVFRGKVKQLDDALQDEERDGELGLEDGKERIKKYKTDIAQLMSDTNVQGKRLKAAKEDVTKWEKIQNGALDNDNEEDYNKATAELTKAQRSVDTYQKQVDKNKVLEDRLRTDCQKFEDAISDAANAMTSLKARKKSAALRKDLAKSQDDLLNEDSPLGKLKAFSDAVDEDEAEAEAFEELASVGNQIDDLEAKYNAAPTKSFAEKKAEREAASKAKSKTKAK